MNQNNHQPRTFHLVLHAALLFLAYWLKEGLCRVSPNITAWISTDFTEDKSITYIVFTPQAHNTLPTQYIAFQLEQQGTFWLDEKDPNGQRYLPILRNAVAILDYAQNNIGFLIQKGLPQDKIFHLPICYTPGYRDFLKNNSYWDGSINDQPCDVIFYGSINERRQQFLDEISKHFSTKIINDKAGNDLIRELLSAKVVVNIHYHQPSTLEVVRLYECLSLGLTVVSETSPNMYEHVGLEQCVYFTEEGNIDAMVQKIRQVLDNPKPIDFSTLNTNHFDKQLIRFLSELDHLQPRTNTTATAEP